MLPGFDLISSLWVGLIFLWAGFVRSGLGFGGAALALPLMLFVNDQPLLWLPVIGTHLLFFSALTLSTRLNQVDWAYLAYSARYIIPAALVGVMGLLNLPKAMLLLFIYGISLFYGLVWLLNFTIQSRHPWADRVLLVLGGYVAGTSLTGAPLMVAVYLRNVAREKLRNSLFVLWFILVALKMTTFVVAGVALQVELAAWLLPIAGVGHMLGLKAHDALLRNEPRFRRSIGAGLTVVSLIGLAALLPGY